MMLFIRVNKLKKKESCTTKCYRNVDTFNLIKINIYK